jgi:hypothetical protein
MSDQYPPFHTFPEDSGPINDVTVDGDVQEGIGMLVAQNGDQLDQVLVHVFLGPTPADGSVMISLNAEGARYVAGHLQRLANFAELGVPAQ